MPNSKERERLKSDEETDTRHLHTLGLLCSLSLASVKRTHKSSNCGAQSPCRQPTSAKTTPPCLLLWLKELVWTREWDGLSEETESVSGNNSPAACASEHEENARVI